MTHEWNRKCLILELNKHEWDYYNNRNYHE
jgi:hypothetical protein